MNEKIRRILLGPDREPDEPAVLGRFKCDVAIVGGGLTGVTTRCCWPGAAYGVLLGPTRWARAPAVTLQHGLKYSNLLDSAGLEKRSRM